MRVPSVWRASTVSMSPAKTVAPFAAALALPDRLRVREPSTTVGPALAPFAVRAAGTIGGWETTTVGLTVAPMALLALGVRANDPCTTLGLTVLALAVSALG